MPNKVREKLIASGQFAEDEDGFLVDLQRPVIIDNEGVHTELTTTVSFGEKGKERYYNIPTIWEGRRLEEQDAVKRGRQYLRDGGELPNYSSLESALAGAKKRSNYITTLRKKEVMEANKKFQQMYGDKNAK